MHRAAAGVNRLGVLVYKRLPLAVRLFMLRRLTPAFRVGATVVVERADGAVLLVRPSYRQRGWGFPGGFLKRGEEPAAGAARELREELGLEVEIGESPMVVVDVHFRRVDVVFTGTVPGAQGQEPDRVVPRSPEISEAGWFAPGELPDLLPETAMAFVELGRASRRDLP